MAGGAGRGLCRALVVTTAFALALPAAALAVPETTITNGPPAFTNSPSATFSFSTDTGTEYRCTLDSNPQATCTTPHTINSVSEGSHTLSVRALDGAGSPDPTPATRSWTVDFTAPETSLDSAPPALTASKDATFTFSSTDAGATFQCSLNGAEYSGCTSPQVFSGLSDATRTFAVRAVDPASNTDGTPPTTTWTVDATAPDTTITDGPAAKSNAVTPAMTFTSTEPGGTFECSTNAGPFVACTSPHGVAGLSDGALTFHVRAKDGAGNPDPTPAERLWQRDTVAPVAPALWLGPRPPAKKRPSAKPSAALGPRLHVTSKFQTTSMLRANWAKGDNQTVSHTLTYRIAFAGSTTFGAVTDWYTKTQKKFSNLTLNPGTTGCFSAYGNDDFGNASPAQVACTTVPYRASSLAAFPGILQKHTGPGYFASQFVGLPVPLNGFVRLNAAAPQNPASHVPGLARVKRVVLVATKCPNCGKVRVVVARKPNNNLPGDIAHAEVIDLTKATFKQRQIVTVHVFANNGPDQKRTFVFVSRAQSPAGSNPRIEGIGISSN